MGNYRRTVYLILIVLLVATGQSWATNFAGSGYFISRNACTDIAAPVTNQTLCWDVTNTRFLRWNGTAWVAVQPGRLQSNSGTQIPNGTQYLVVEGQGTSSTESVATMIAPTSGTVSGLTCFVVTAPTLTHTWTITFQTSVLPAPLTATSLNCTISAGSNSCTDSSDTAPVTAGWGWDYKVVNNGAGSSNIACSAVIQ